MMEHIIKKMQLIGPFHYRLAYTLPKIIYMQFTFNLIFSLLMIAAKNKNERYFSVMSIFYFISF